jgi:hypothetical protein
VSFSWICAVCVEPKNDRPAYERQLLFPGCGGVCGHQVRICATCFPTVRILSADRLEELLQGEHARYHQLSPPVTLDPAHITKKQEKKL